MSNFFTEDDEDLTEKDDYYAWLGLSKSASQGEINNSFRRLSRMYHPDKHATDPEKKANAERLFTKIKHAHEVLSDPHKKAIYDTIGVKGLETEGWEVVSRNKLPREILEEYRDLKEDHDRRRMEQRTNPKGTIQVGIDATELFDPYIPSNDEEYSSGIPNIEINSMSISQSVEAPLDASNTGILAGSLSTHNGNGTGNLNSTFRHITSNNGWAEVEVGVGSQPSLALRAFRTVWKLGFGMVSASLQQTPNGNIAPTISIMAANQLSKNLQGRMTWLAGAQSAVNSNLIWETEQHRAVLSLQIGIPFSFIHLSYLYKFQNEDQMKFRTSLKFGTFGGICEYGCEKKVSKFSNLGCSVAVGYPSGVSLKVKVYRGQQRFLFPIHLADNIIPSAIVYGTFIPIVSYLVVQSLIVSPFIKNIRESEKKNRQTVNAEKLAERKKNAELSIDLMEETISRCFEREKKIGGLVIKKALFGRLTGSDLSENEAIIVTKPLQACVKDSKLIIPAGTTLSELPGFYDPCIGEKKHLAVTYEFRRELHICKISEDERLFIPSKSHKVKDNNIKIDGQDPLKFTEGQPVS